MVVFSVSTVSASLSSSAPITSGQVVSSITQPEVQHQQLQLCQQGVDIVSIPTMVDSNERTEANLVKSLPNTSIDNCSMWQRGSINGSLPVSRHRHNSPDHSPRRLQRPDLSPYRVRMADRSPLRQQPVCQSVALGMCPSSWHSRPGSSDYCSNQRNGLVLPAEAEHMDTSDEMPLNLSVRVQSSAPSAQQSNNINNRRRIFPSG